MNNKEENKLNLLERVVEYYYEKYNIYFSGSSNPRKPQENRDRMLSKLNDLLNDNPLEEIFNNLSYEEWIEFLEKKNKLLKENVKKFKLSYTQKEKCEKKGLYLFISKEWNTYKNEIILSNMGY
jgi:uncharacterized membrane protein YheB (UPF0754 family)